jgi:hypothetical protein
LFLTNLLVFCSICIYSSTNFYETSVKLGFQEHRKGIGNQQTNVGLYTELFE